MATKPITTNLKKSSSPVLRETPQPVDQVHRIYINGMRSGYVRIKLQQLKHPGSHSPSPDKKCFVEFHEQLGVRGITTGRSSSVDYDRIIEESTGSYWVDYATFTSADEYAGRPCKLLVSRFAETVVADACPRCNTKAELFMRIDYQYVFEEAALTAWVDQEAMEQINMVPTQEAVIEGLNKECLQDDHDFSSDQQCMVCLDEFSVASEVSKLPCSHVYNWSCIVEWLRTSHFCPTCRYCFPYLEEENVLEEEDNVIYVDVQPLLRRMMPDSHPSFPEEGDSPVS